MSTSANGPQAGATGAYTQEHSDFTKPDMSQAGMHSQVELAQYNKSDESKVQAVDLHGERTDTDVEHVETNDDGENETQMI